MQSLRGKLGYASLKTIYMEDLAKNFSSLNGIDNVATEMNEDDESVMPMNTIEQKDRKIAALLKDIEYFKVKDEQINSLKEALTKSTAKLKSAKKSFYTSQQKLNFTKKATENYLIEFCN